MKATCRYSYVDRYSVASSVNIFWANLTTNSVMESGEDDFVIHEGCTVKPLLCLGVTNT